MKCPTCDSTERDIFLPVSGIAAEYFNYGLRICQDPWHEDRIVKNEGQTRAKAAPRRAKERKRRANAL